MTRREPDLFAHFPVEQDSTSMSASCGACSKGSRRRNSHSLTTNIPCAHGFPGSTCDVTVRYRNLSATVNIAAGQELDPLVLIAVGRSRLMLPTNQQCVFPIVDSITDKS